ncbi:hypothetical protein MHYP_G00146580 [Metynnis hypsauchen]
MQTEASAHLALRLHGTVLERCGPPAPQMGFVQGWTGSRAHLPPSPAAASEARSGSAEGIHHFSASPAELGSKDSISQNSLGRSRDTQSYDFIPFIDPISQNFVHILTV